MTVWVHLGPCVFMIVEHDVLCNVDVYELIYPAVPLESCVFLYLCLKLGGVYLCI